MPKEHICQVYDFVGYRDALLDLKRKKEQENITLNLFTIRDMITNGYDPSSPEDIIKYWQQNHVG